MELIMDIILTVNLLGAISGPVAHTTRQTVTVDITPLGQRQPVKMTKKILHTDRYPTYCVRKIHLSAEQVKYFQSGDTPYWSADFIWKKMSKLQRLEAHLARFDEGYGIDYEMVDYGENE